MFTLSGEWDEQDRCEGLLADASIVRVKLSELQLRRPRQWGACWLALLLRTKSPTGGLVGHPLSVKDIAALGLRFPRL